MQQCTHVIVATIVLLSMFVLPRPKTAEGADARLHIDWKGLPSPVIFRGTRQIAYRDPAATYLNGTFHLFFTLTEIETDGRTYWYTAKATSTDLKHWTEPKRITPRDSKLNFSSPGNIVRFNGQSVLCLQTYPTPKGQHYGDETARAWIMRSTNLEHWAEPEMLRLKGPRVPVAEMGRIIDPFLLQDRNDPGKWWCFFKQNGINMSWSRDLTTWTYRGKISSGENPCVLLVNGEYILFYSPGNGIGIKRSKDLQTWTDTALLTLGQASWEWAQGRLTAGFVIDLRHEPRVGKYVMFFHGGTREGKARHSTHAQASLGLAWSDDLRTWRWPGGSEAANAERNRIAGTSSQGPKIEQSPR